MDACLSILVPKGTSYGQFESHVPVHHWGGEAYPQCDEAEFQWGRVSFVEEPVPSYLDDFLPEACRRVDWKSLYFPPTVLALAYSEVHDQRDVDWEGPGLFKALPTLLARCSQWCVVFEMQCDEIDMVVSVDVDEAVALLRRMLEPGEAPKGFLAFHC